MSARYKNSNKVSVYYCTIVHQNNRKQEKQRSKRWTDYSV